uniref:ATPbinding cassette subfamily F member 1 putative n=1 Tax=Albugo laibachii Nc14 TaxID=890382 RepID=F0WPH8_9STRA|nr:ATPbinding cassette subfamily F member 1 putative [Albugo laibachii Nc14]|eukprot:CCA23226.1 ATPbinding cassette subfamily F member 1 putative [Albugo laibachii Nc14]
MARKKNRRSGADLSDGSDVERVVVDSKSSETDAAKANKKEKRKEKLKARKAMKQQGSAEKSEKKYDDNDDEVNSNEEVVAPMKKNNKSLKTRSITSKAVSFSALNGDSTDEDEYKEGVDEQDQLENTSREKVEHGRSQVEADSSSKNSGEATTKKSEDAPADTMKKQKKKKIIPTSLFFDPVEPADSYDASKKEKKDKSSKRRLKKSVLLSTPSEEDVNTQAAEVDDSEEEGSSKKEGKRLSNKERKRLKEEKERQKREEEYHKAVNPLDGSQFAVSQQALTEDANWENATDIHIDNFTINAHSKLLFDDASLHINHGGKYGLVGPNGQGKTTLLKMIAIGELKIPPKIDCLYVEQEVVADETRAVDAVLKADTQRWALLEEEANLLAQLEKQSDPSLDDRLNEVYEQLAVADAAAAESRARRILFGLGFDSDMQEKATQDFSGGWRMRISLAKALYVEPTLLMLDEPTNHLDLNAVIWLDDYLQKWKKTLLVVSHDADFLNSICTEVLHLENRKIAHYKGNYDQFREMELQKRKQMEKAWEKQQKQLRNLKASGKSSKKATEIVKKKREPGARATKKKSTESTESALVSSDQTDLLERPREYIVKFSFPEISKVSPPILEVREVSFRYNESTPYLFKNIDFGIDTDSRICIVGPNGVGKSTLLKIVTDEVRVREGEVRLNPRIRVGIYNQHFVDKLPMGETPVEYLRRLFQDQTYQQVRNLLGKVGLEGHAHEIKNRLLSGGQKARVVIAELVLMRPHILILDEPTNNLDIESIDALCDAIKEYDGGVVIVTHDARLIESTNCLLWVVGDQDVVEFDGKFSDYRQLILDDLAKKASMEEERLQDKALKKSQARATLKTK